MTVAELLARMSSAELTEWMAYDEYRTAQQKLAEKMAESKRR